MDDNYASLEKKLDDSHASLEKQLDDRHASLEKNIYLTLDSWEKSTNIQKTLTMGLFILVFAKFIIRLIN
jgi:hypothetical protein